MATMRAVHQCLFCPQTFGSAAEKDDHILGHFAQETCGDCNQKLIRIGANFYTLHNAVTCIKRDFKTEPHFESCFVEQPILFNEQSRECITTVDKIKVEEEIEDYSEELRNRTKATNNSEADEHVTSATANNDDNGSGRIADDFAFDSNFSDGFNSDSESFAEKQDFVFESENEKNSNFVDSKQIVKVDIMKNQTEQRTEPKVHCCENCSKKFTTEKKLTEHRLKCSVKREVGPSDSHTKQEKLLPKKATQLKFACQKCEKSYSSAASLHKHNTSKHNPPGTHVCLSCSTVCMTQTELTNHRVVCRLKRRNRLKHLIDANPTFVCYLCKTTCKSISSVIGHMRWKHQPNGVKYKCNVCGSAFFSKDAMEIHLKRHTQPVSDRKIICSICGICVKKSDSLKVHMLIHAGEKPFPCTHDGCSKAFRSKSSRAEHMRRHTKEKPFTCTIDGCDEKFSYATNFRRHKFKAHGISTKKLPCSVCGEVFPEAFLLKKHLRKHEH